MTKEHKTQKKQKELQAKESTGVEVEMVRKRTEDAGPKPGKTQKSTQYFVLSTKARALSSLEV